MDLYSFVLFLHIVVVLAAMALAGLLHLSEWMSPRARTVAELRLVSKPQRNGVLFVPVIILLFALGAWLLHLSQRPDQGHFRWGDGWVWTAIVALGVLLVSGGGIVGRHASALIGAAAAAPDGPVSPELRGMTLETVPWVTAYGSTALAIGVVFNMANKPNASGAIIVLVGATVIGVLFGLIVLKRSQEAANVSVLA